MEATCALTRHMTRCSLVTSTLLWWQLCHVAGLLFRAGLLLSFLPVRHLLLSVPYMTTRLHSEESTVVQGPCIANEQAVHSAGIPASQLLLRC